MQYRPHRYPTEFPIDVRTPFGPQRARVMDVNATGAAIRGIEGLERGNKVFLNLLSQNIEGIVRPQISDDQLDTLRYRRDSRGAFRPGSIGYRQMEMR